MHTPVFHNCYLLSVICYLLSVICPGSLLCKDILLFLKQANPNETDCNNTGMPVSPSSQTHLPLCLFTDIQCIYALLASERERTNTSAVTLPHRP